MNTKNKNIMSSALLALVFALGADASLAKDATKPDLNGLWSNASLTGLTRPANLKTLVISPEEAARVAAGTNIAGLSPEEINEGTRTDPNEGAPEKGGSDFGLRGYNSFWVDPGSSLAKVRGEFRSSYIIDPANGKVPKLANPKVKFNDRGFRARYVTGVGGNSDPEALPNGERCLIGFGNTSGPGMMGVLYNSNYQFVQTDDYLMILVEMIHDARIIPLFKDAKTARANHRPDVIKPWAGDSVGWYEGNTLVVETTHFYPLQMEQSAIQLTENGVLTERFTRYAEDEIDYQFTVDDPNLYSQPWTAELSFYPAKGQIFEYACHEGNYAMEGILSGARLKEKQAMGKNK